VTNRSGTAAAILAGGRATRLGGTPKASLRLGAGRIIDRQVPILRAVAEEVFIVAPDAGPFADLGLNVVPDVIPDAGALGGIYTAIVASPCQRTLVVACDMPFLGAALLEHLVETDEADLVVPHGRQGYEPLCAVYARTCAEPIRRQIERGNLRAAAIPDAVRSILSVVEIGPEVLGEFDRDGLMFVNVNTPHDYERARSLVDSE
jgi:molybdopterin-guanine dinucleotide biosynthesis protein A